MAVTEIRTLHNGAKIYECASSDIGSLPAAPVDSCAVVTDSPGLLMIVDASGDWQQAPQTSRDFAGAPGRVGTLASVAALHDSQQITQTCQQITQTCQQIAHLWREDYLHDGSNNPYLSQAVSTGTKANELGTSKHPGVLRFSSSTAANSGYQTRIGTSSIMLGGGEKSTYCFKTAPVLTSVTRRMMFHDCSDQNDAVDGVYLEIVDAILKGKSANNSTRTETATTYTVSANTWYRGKVELNSDATLATFTLYADDSETVLWTDTVAENIPKTRETGNGDVCTSSGTTAIIVGYIDYMDMILPNTRRV